MDKQEIKKIIEDNISNIGNQAPWGAALSKIPRQASAPEDITQYVHVGDNVY